MASTKIKRDVHGLYVRTGGSLFRPQANRHAQTHPLSVGMGTGGYFKNGLATHFSEGDEVAARHLGGSTSASIKQGVREEYWHSHGCYLGKKTHECFEN